jgi:hypothetical protein
MSRILIIQPSKMLRHALAIALSPEHQLQFMASLPELADLTEVDGVIVDAATLRDHDALTTREVRAVQGWKIPTVWIDGAGALQAPVRKTLVQLKHPVRKEDLQKALADSLGPAVESKQSATASEGHTAARATPKTKKSKEAAGPADNRFIELLEVVEDEQAQGK